MNRRLTIPFVLPILMIIAHCSDPASTTQKRPQVIVDQDITEDTVWESGCDVLLKGRVVVEAGICLTIKPSVNIIFEDERSFLEIYGKLMADGDDEKSRIIFKSAGIQQNDSRQKCISALENSKLSLSMCEFEGFLIGVNSTQGCVILEDDVFRACNRGIYIVQSDTCMINKCVFNDNEIDVMLEKMEHTDLMIYTIVNCEFFDTKGAGLRINDYGYVTIHNNRFSNCKQGIYCEWNSTAIITNNDFFDCETGINFYRCYERGRIERNEINNSDSGINLYASFPDIQYNNILTCTDFKVKSNRNFNVVTNAENNWWGTAIEGEIQSDIYDGNYPAAPYDVGFVDFIPYLNQKVDDAGVL